MGKGKRKVSEPKNDNSSMKKLVNNISSKWISMLSNSSRKGAFLRTLLFASISITLVSLVLSARNRPGMSIVFYYSVMLTVVILARLIIHALYENDKYLKLALILHRCFITCLIVGVAGFAILQILIFSGSRTQDADIDCIIVLGAGLYGEVPSRILVSRLDAALDYLHTRKNVPIIVSGGQGPGETITEAEAMFRYLVRNGADASLILKEDSSTNTSENIAYSTFVMEEIGLDISTSTIAIVTNEFHLYRAKHIANAHGLEVVGVAAKTPYPTLRILYHFREAIALMKEFISPDAPMGAGLLIAPTVHYINLTSTAVNNEGSVCL